MIDNKEADLYIKNELMNDTVNLYCNKLAMIQADLNRMAFHILRQSDASWSGAGREGFEEGFGYWKGLALEALEDIEGHKRILDEILIDSASLYNTGKDIADDMD